ncbi:MAG TPA: 4'-phosphopantetheinyl transferase superfamily protein [Methylomusa anaerophila]|uniref:4'-phosphopantetheinyl transferase n=1 Tax=Methylomusa anaerophila TaxID=1930071 RepID=A0A348AQW6_9FIRM|nr:4'-phosphopantetheinyl transferase superfamily protein [Methylomusa anaerophila]BBB93464.1 4'-phosphopantetheinyl transferase [Methylomusa anaerophila]HML90582.1 4'-phosphopantetheinyl transferase superfamily protein [Methylomusa anaerophila]
MRNRNIFIDEFDLIRPENKFSATLCCCSFSHKIDYEGIIQYLHTQERNYYNTLKFEKRSRSYLIGRFAAKQAVAALTGEEKLTDIVIQSGVFTHPIVISNKQNIQVSITHCEDYGAALAFPEAHPMGIDLERIDPCKRDVLTGQNTEFEATRIVPLVAAAASYDAGLTLLWTAKEALSKILKTGLMTPFELFEISRIDIGDDFIMCYYKNFAQYKAMSFIVDNYMYSIAYPIKTQLHFDVRSLKENYLQAAVKTAI